MTTPRLPIARRVLRWLAAAGAGLLLALVAAAVWLTAHPGRERIRRAIVDNANAAIAGRLDVGAVAVGLDGTFVIEGLVLRDPDGAVVARIRRVVVETDLSRLAARRVRIRSARIEAPELYLASTAQGLNLARAVRANARTRRFAACPGCPGPPSEPAADPFGAQIDVDAIAIVGGHVEVRDAGRLVQTIRDVRLDANGAYGRSRVEAELALSARAAGAVDGPVRLGAAMRGPGGRAPDRDVELTGLVLSVGGSRLWLGAAIRGGPGEERSDESGRTIVLRHLAAELRRSDLARVPGLAPRHDVLVRGEGRWDGRGGRAALTLAEGEAVVRAEALAHPSGAALELSGEVRLFGVDLSALVAAAPTHLSGRVAATFRIDPDGDRGRVEASLERGTVAGHAAGPLSLRATVGGTPELAATVEALACDLPGAQLSATGVAGARTADLRARLAVADLGGLARFLAAASGGEPGDAAGRGAVEATLAGPWRALRATAAARFPALSAGAFVAAGLALDAEVPNLRRPWELTGRLSAERGTAGEVPFSTLRGEVRAAGRHVELDLTTAGTGAAQIRVVGDLDPDLNGGTLSEARVVYPAARWALEAPARIDLAAGAAVDRLALAGDRGGRVWIAGGLRRRALDARAAAEQIDLAALPPWVVPPRLGLAGRLDASATLGGTSDAPSAALTIAVRGVSARGPAGRPVEGVDVDVRATLAGDRASADATIRRGPAAIRARADLPWRVAEAAPIAASVEAGGLSATDLAGLLGVADLAGGALSATAVVSGTVDAPRVRLEVQARDARWRDLPPVSAAAAVGAADGRATATLDLAAPHGALKLSAAVPLDGRAALREPARLRALAGAPLQATLRAADFDLAPLAGRAGLPGTLAGSLSAEGDLTGSARAPRGRVAIEARGVALGAAHGLGARVEIALTDRATGLLAPLTAGGRPAGRVLASVALPVERVLDAEALARAAVDLRAELGPVELATVADAAGTVQARVQVGGSLGEPTADASADATGVVLAQQPVGDARLTAHYRGGRAEAGVRLAPSAGGVGEAKAHLDRTLGLGELRAGVDWGSAPMGATLRLTDLDLAFLPTVTEAVRRARGKASADVALSGTLGARRLAGRAAIAAPRLALAGYGELRDLAVEARVTERSAAIERLEARLGDGSLSAHLAARRESAETPWAFAGELSSERFPFFRNDQLFAFVTARPPIVLAGQLGGDALDATVRVPGLALRLAPLESKDLQSLDPHPDVVVVDSRRRRAATPAGVGPAPTPLRLRVAIDAPRTIEIRSDDVAAIATAHLEVERALGPLQVGGEVESTQGKVEALGRAFEVKRARVQFTGPPSDPAVDILATHHNKAEKVKVHVAVTGTAQRPQVDLSSEPPLEPSQIAALLATGRRELKRGTGEVGLTAGAASAIGSFAADRLRRAVGRVLPVNVDVATVRVGEAGVGAEIGKYLTDSVYLGYTYDSGADPAKGENQNAAKVEVQLGEAVQLEVQFGDAGTGGAEMVWSRDF